MIKHPVKTRVILPKPNELFVDCDDSDHVQIAFNRLNRLTNLKWIRPIWVSCSPSKTRGHWHIIVTLKDDIGVLERITLQLILGSDPDRELYSYARWKNQAPYPILFIEEN